jgi:threonine/homoserine/homoserine lactone efflux protein
MPSIEFLVAVLVLELTPGPNMAYLAALSLSRGRWAGLLATAGVAAGLAVHAVLAALGAGVLIERSPLAYEVLRWCGVLYLLWLAWESWRGEGETSAGQAVLGEVTRRLFWRGFLSNVFNPKSILFFVSVVPRFIEPGGWSPPVQLALLGSAYVAVATGVHTAIVLLAAQLEPWLSAGPGRDIVRRVLALALAAIAVWLAWTTRR